MNRPQVSIIINCFNSEEFLKEAINSIYSQTFKDWEIIFWDNNSSDRSAKIAKSFGKKLHYFKSETTLRLYEARNLALEKCRGDYIAFLDCDDIWVNTKLEKQISAAMKGNSIVYGNYKVIDEKGDIIPFPSKKLKSGMITNNLFRHNSISIGCVMIERSIILNSIFDPSYDLLGDFDLWIRLSIRNKIFALDTVLEFSRVHKKNISKSLQHKWLIERNTFTESI